MISEVQGKGRRSRIVASACISSMIRLASATRAWSIKYVARCESRYPGMHYCHTRVMDVCDSRTERRKCSITARLTSTIVRTHTTDDGQIVRYRVPRHFCARIPTKGCSAASTFSIREIPSTQKRIPTILWKIDESNAIELHVLNFFQFIYLLLRLNRVSNIYLNDSFAFVSTFHFSLEIFKY